MIKAEHAQTKTVQSDTVGYYHRSKLCCLGIHVFTETPPTQKSQKVVRFMQNEPPHLFLYRTQLTNVNICFYLTVSFNTNWTYFIHVVLMISCKILHLAQQKKKCTHVVSIQIQFEQRINDVLRLSEGTSLYYCNV